MVCREALEMDDRIDEAEILAKDMCEGEEGENGVQKWRLIRKLCLLPPFQTAVTILGRTVARTVKQPPHLPWTSTAYQRRRTFDSYALYVDRNRLIRGVEQTQLCVPH